MEEQEIAVHTLLFVGFPEKNQRPWQMNHVCVAHIWLTDSEEYVVFIPREN
jgi:hypothetical protein